MLAKIKHGEEEQPVLRRKPTRVSFRESTDIQELSDYDDDDDDDDSVIQETAKKKDEKKGKKTEKGKKKVYFVFHN